MNGEFKKLLTVIMIVLNLIGMVGCESEEEYKARVINSVKTKMETALAEEPQYNQLTNKEWSYSKTKDGQEIVTLTGTITYIVQMPVTIQYYIDTKEGYITKATITYMDETRTENVPKSKNSKLDL
ncbi:MAG: hypothetical protein SOZ04_06075 [Bacilli bacterium]|nr:hypothetical protein [Bacilli bacterium]